MKATCRIGFVTRCPPTKTSPSVGRYRPAPMLSSVLLPQPEGPMSETTSPRRTCTFTPRTAQGAGSAPPRPRGAKRLETARNSISSGAVAGSGKVEAIRMFQV